MKIQINDQLQLTLTLPNRTTAGKCSPHRAARQRRLRRAGLWFEHMRRVVGQAHEWPAAEQSPTPPQNIGSSNEAMEQQAA
jgi:hypothetical protein